MKSNSIMTDLRFLTFIPIAVIGIVFLFFIFTSAKQFQELQILQKNNSKIENISKLVTHLQQERGLSSGYIGSKGAKFVLQLAKVRQRVDNDYKKLKLGQNLLDTRSKVIDLHISTIESFLFYTKIIKDLQMHFISTAQHINDSYLTKQLQAYTNLSYTQEALGEIRGSFNGIFSNKNALDKALLYNALNAKGMYDNSLKRFYATASQKISKQIYSILESQEYKSIENTIAKYSMFQIKKPTEDPQKWFKTTTDIINKIDDIKKSYTTSMRIYIQNKSYTIKSHIILQILILLSIFIFSFWFSSKLKNSILRDISLLSQYKDAVDRSSIVSKTDKRGKITYVNDKFCTISGYTKKELIGKAHNIIRHPDMPKSAFKDMWQTILEKKPWFGIVKNKTKSGGYYIVEATINPILNHKGEIEEFIAIKNNITDVVKLHERDRAHTKRVDF